MAGYNTVRSALRLSAIIVAAGTILGLSSTAAAQSRLERAERALQKAQQELEAARRDSGRTEQRAGQRIELKCEVSGAEGSCEGQACEAGEGQDCNGQACDGEQREIELTVTDDDEDGPIVVQGQPLNRFERKIVVGGGGHNCPACGRPMEGPTKGQSGAWFQKIPGGLIEGHAGGNPHVQVFGLGEAHGEGHGGGQPHAFTWREGGDGDKEVIVLQGQGGRRVRGFPLHDAEGGEKEIIILRGDREWRDSDESGPRQEKRIEIRRHGGDEAPAGGGQKRIQIQRIGPDGAEGGAPHNKMFRIDGPNTSVSGKVIIVGPDGQRQEFDLGNMGGGAGGGMGGGKGGGAGANDQPTRRRVPGVQIQEFRDGDAGPAHHDQQGERRVIQLRKVSRPL